MARRTPSTTPPPSARKRRTAEEARVAILDAAERQLVARGPSGIRLQEVAAEVGVSHPTVLHHFGSREGLLEAVVARSLDSLHADLLRTIQASPKTSDQVTLLLDRVYATLAGTGHARAFLWLALAGYEPSIEQLHVRALSEVVHEARCAMVKQTTPKKKLPTFEDTYFTMLLPALALMAMAVTAPKGAKASEDDEPCSPRRFRAWLGKLIHQHLERA
jgi:AcrR family transcriptional regulator